MSGINNKGQEYAFAQSLCLRSPVSLPDDFVAYFSADVEVYENAAGQRALQIELPDFLRILLPEREGYDEAKAGLMDGFTLVGEEKAPVTVKVGDTGKIDIIFGRAPTPLKKKEPRASKRQRSAAADDVRDLQVVVCNHLDIDVPSKGTLRIPTTCDVIMRATGEVDVVFRAPLNIHAMAKAHGDQLTVHMAFEGDA